MRPLAVLDPLPPFEDVYDPVADDFTQLLSDQTDTFDSLQALLNPPADQALADVTLLSDTIDAIGAVFDGLDGTFGALNGTLESVDYTQRIQEVIILENDFYGGLDTFNPDAQPVVDNILNYILNLLSQLIVWIIQQLYALFSALVNLIENLLAGVFAYSFWTPPEGVTLT